jgi:uncharacterized protein (DUF58 family)
MANPAVQRSARIGRNSGKYLGVAACLVGSFFFLAFQGGKLAAMLFTIVLILSIYFVLGRFSGITSAKGVRTLSGERNAEYVAGTSVPVHVQISLPRYWPFPYIIVKDRLVSHRGEVYTFETTFVPDWRLRGEVRYTTPPLRRGVYHFEDTVCTTEDIFGLFQHHGTLSMRHPFSVYPKTVAIREWAHFHYLTKGMHHHAAVTYNARETTQFNGVRDYVYGDRMSRIHWNATARTGTWKSKEFEKETLPKSIVILDCDRAAYPDAERFELAVSVAASLFRYGLMNELTLGLLYAAGPMQFVPPARGETHYKNVLDHLIRVEANGSQPLDALMKSRDDLAAEGCFFIIISPRGDEMMAKVARLLLARQANACQIRILTRPAAEKAEERRKPLYRTEIRTYPVANLADLPLVLGGRP